MLRVLLVLTPSCPPLLLFGRWAAGGCGCFFCFCLGFCDTSLHQVGTTSSIAKAFLQDYGAKAVASVRSALAAHKGWGAFVPACLQHTDDICMTEGPVIRSGDGGRGTGRTGGGGGLYSYGQSLGAWFFENGGNVNTTLFDSCTDGMPCNPQCTGFHCQDS